MTGDGERKGRITLEDIARSTGFSRATVSRVLNDKKSVKPSTVKIVEQAIEQLSYRPNVSASALSGGRTMTVAVCLPETLRPYYSILLGGIENISSQKGYDIIFKTKNYPRAARELAESRRVDGMIIRNMKEDAEHAQLFRELVRCNIPFVLIGKPMQEYPSIHIDNVGGARKVAHHFAEHGYRRILCITGPNRHVDAIDRVYGFKMGLSERGIDPEGVTLAEGDYSKEQAFNLMKEHFPKPQFDAVFAANDNMALGVLLYLRRIGMRVPEDMGLAGFDDSFFSEYLFPPLTTVRQPMYEMGSIAMETVVSLMEGSTREKGIILPTQLVVRRSCGCPYTYNGVDDADEGEHRHFDLV